MSKKKVYFVSIHKTGKGTREITTTPDDKYLTIGEAPESDIKASIPGLPGKLHRLIEKKGKGYILRIPSNLKGSITIGSSTLSVDGIIKFGLLKKKGDCCIFTLPDKDTCTLAVEDYTLTFGYKEITLPKKETVKLDRSLKRPWISREDYAFFIILALTTAINFSVIGYLSTIEIKKKESLETLKTLAPRFAKLILQPPVKKVVKKTFAKQSPDETKEEEKKKKEKEDKKQEEPVKEAKEETVKQEEPVKEAKKETVKQEEPVKEAKEETVKQEEPVKEAKKEGGMPPAPEKPLPNITKEQIRKVVKSKGLLGVITAKSRPVDIADSAIFRNIDDRMKGSKWGSAGRRVEDILAGLDIKDIKSLEDDASGDIGGIKQGTAEPRDVGEIIKEKKKVQIEETANDETRKTSIATAGKRNETEVYRTIQSYVGGLKYLYNNALKKDPSLRGKVTVKLVISVDGKVKNAEVVSSTLNASELEDAIVNRIYKWRFTEIQEGEEFITNYTFDFTPLG